LVVTAPDWIATGCRIGPAPDRPETTCIVIVGSSHADSGIHAHSPGKCSKVAFTTPYAISRRARQPPNLANGDPVLSRMFDEKQGRFRNGASGLVRMEDR
jgi:hypothetical protein